MDRAKADAILAALEGGKSLRAACLGLCDPATVFRWCDANPEFAQQYADARARGYKLLADEILEISDENEGKARLGEDGELVDVTFDATAVARNRLRVDSRKWMLAKMLPKVYGDKLDVAHSGELKFTRIEREIVRPQPKDQDG